MGVPFPNRDPRAWNTVKIGSVTLAGILSVGVKPGQDVEVKKAKGGVGASTTVQGPKPAKVTIKLTMLRQEHLDQYIAALPVLLPMKDSGEPQPFSHPKATIYGISSIVVEDIDDPPNEEVGDRIVVTISASQFRPAGKKKVTKPARLEPRNNNLTSGRAANQILVERPSRDPRNRAPRP